jgi:hypothetical protein
MPNVINNFGDMAVSLQVALTADALSGASPDGGQSTIHDRPAALLTGRPDPGTAE